MKVQSYEINETEKEYRIDHGSIPVFCMYHIKYNIKATLEEDNRDYIKIRLTDLTQEKRLLHYLKEAMKKRQDYTYIIQV